MRILVLALACLIPLIWYQAGTVISVADYNNPLDAGRWIEHVLSGWDPDNLGGPSLREIPLLFPYLLFWRAGQLLGLAAGTTQMLWFVFLFAVAAMSMSALIRRIAPRRAGWAGVVVVLVFLFNPFTVTSWAVGHNVQFLAYACAPLWIAKLLDVWRGPPSLLSGLGPALVSLLFASAFNNPSIIFTMIVLPALVVGAVMLLGRTVRPGNLLAGTGSVLLWVLLLHAWWWIPMASGLLSAGGYEYAGASWNLLDYPGIATNVPSGEFLRGLGFWEMYSSHHGEPYFPWSASYGHPILVVATSWLVGLAFVPALLRRRVRAWAVVAALFALLGIFFSKGVNPPLGEVNGWLFENVPGFYLFRGTYEKFAPLTFLGVSIGLAALILHRAPRSRLRSYVVLGTLGAILLGGWPLFTGDVASTLTRLGVTPRVRIPGYYRTFESWTRDGAEGSVLVVPQSPIGYVKTTWGYSGHDLIQNYSSKPVVMGWPEARPKDGPRFRAFLSLADSYDRPALLQRHGIGHVLVRYDMDPGFYEGTPGPRVVEARLRQQGFVFERTIGRFQIYRNPLAVSPVRAQSELLGRPAGADGTSTQVETTSAVGTDALTTSRAPTWCTPSPVSVDPSGEWLEADCPIEGPVQVRPLPPYRFSFEAASRGGHVQIALDPAATVIEAGGSLVSIGSPGFDVELDAGDGGGAIRLGDALIPVTRGPGYSAAGSLLLEPGTPAQVLQAVQGNLLEDGSFEETLWSGAYDLDGRRTGEIAILQSSDATDGAFSMELHAEGEEAFASRRLTGSMDPRASYLLSFDYRSVEGGPAGFAVWEEGGGGYATQDLRLEPSREWRHVEVAVDPSPRAEGLEVFLYSLASPGEVTVNRFDDVRLRELLPSTDVALPEIRVAPGPSVTLSDGAGVRFPTTGSRRGLLEDGSFEESVWNGANDKLAAGVRGVALAARPSPDATAGERSLELAAARGGVYTSRFVEPFDAHSVYRLSFDYKNVSGGPAGFGVWETGTERYAAQGLSLPPSSGWKHVERLFVPSEQAAGLGLYLYTFTEEGPAVTRFDDVEISSVPLPSTVVLVGGGTEGTDPALEVEHVTPTSASGTIRVSGSAWIVLPQSFHPNWRLDLGVPEEQARVTAHTMVDGFANGWLIEGSGDVSFAVTYEGRRPLATGAGVTAIGALIGGTLVLYRRRKRSRGALRPPGEHEVE